MNTPLRIRQYKLIKEGIKHFDLLGGLRMIARNFKKLFTHDILTGGNKCTVVKSEIETTVSDFSLVCADGSVLFQVTSEGADDKNAVIYISQKV